MLLPPLKNITSLCYTNFAALVADLYGIKLAPHLQGAFLGFRLESIPLIEHAPSIQQILEFGVGAPSAENLPNVVKVVGQKLAGEVQRERLPEIELSLVRYGEEFLAVVDVIRQYVQVVAELGIDLPLILWTPDQAAWRSACSGVIYPRAECSR